MTENNRWDRVLLSLPEDSFFDIMRNYLGNIKTPFNKHRLIEKLIKFLNRKETTDRILSFIDETDSKILTALHLLNNPTIEILSNFFSKEIDHLELYHILLNMEERLLIFRETDSNSTKISITPFLKQILKKGIISPSFLFPSRPVNIEKVIDPLPWLNDSLLTAFLSFLLKQPNILKTNREVKQKSITEIFNIFPVLKEKSVSGNRLDILLNALINIGLIYFEENSLKADIPKWEKISKINHRERLYILREASIRDRNLSPLESCSISRHPGIMRKLLTLLPANRSFPLSSIEYIIQILSENERITTDIDRFVSSLVDLDLLIIGKNKTLRKNRNLVENENCDKGGIVIQPNFEIIPDSEVVLEDGLLISLVSDIVKFDLCPTYTINKNSFLRAISTGLSTEKILEWLTALNRRRLPQNIQFSFETWGKEYQSISLYEGIILNTDEDRAHVIDNTNFLTPWIKKKIAPGVYLLDPGEKEMWEKELQNTGIDFIPEIQNFRSKTVEYGFPSSKIDIKPSFDLSSLSKKAVFKEKEKREFTQQLYSSLNSAGLPAELKEEYSARIKKRLILFPEQINKEIIRPEKKEAKGFDFSGKIRLIEQAIESGKNLLEVIEKTSEAAPSLKILLKPVRLEKKENRFLLVGTTLPEKKTVKIEVGKIGFVKKLKNSLFAP